MPLQSVDDVHGDDGLPTGMLGVGDGVLDDGFEEDLEYIAGFLVNEPRDSLDTAATRQTTNGRLGDALDVITKHFAMPFRSSFSQSCLQIE